MQILTDSVRTAELRSPPLASIVIPNWNGEQHLPVCLDALRAQTYPHVEVIVVDNASTDGSQTLVRERYPEVRLLVLDRNLGLTGGNNAGFHAAQGEFLISLNNDTEAAPHFVEALVAALVEHSEAGMAAAKMLLFDRRDIIHSAGDGYGRDGIPYNRGVWQRDEGQFDEPGWIFGGCGGAVAYRRAMLDEIAPCAGPSHAKGAPSPVPGHTPEARRPALRRRPLCRATGQAGIPGKSPKGSIPGKRSSPGLASPPSRHPGEVPEGEHPGEAKQPRPRSGDTWAVFDESFFMYCEDVDLNWRAQLAGWRCWYTPEAVVYHKLSATGGGPLASYYTGRNTLWVVAKHYPVTLLRKHWRRVLDAQWRVAREALRACGVPFFWRRRGEAACARLRGQMAGLWGWPRLRRARRARRPARHVPDDYIERLLSG